MAGPKSYGPRAQLLTISCQIENTSERRYVPSVGLMPR
jgi:hypothetical protein